MKKTFLVPVLFYIIMALFESAVDGEIRFVCPRPQTPATRNMSQAPCGAGSMRDFSSDFTILRPGPFTIRLEETFYRKGSPGRISLRKFDSGETPCVILDFIPHNDAVTVNTKQSLCSLNDYPLGRCNSDTYLTVNIPDIECDKCILQFMTVDMTEKSSPCNVTETFSNCTTNFTCANVKIVPSGAGQGKGLEACQNYDTNVGGPWTYTRTYSFQVNLMGSAFADGYARLYLTKYNTLKYDIDLGTVMVVPNMDKIHIVHEGQRMFEIPLTGKQMTGRIYAFDSIPQQFLKGNTLFLDIEVLSARSNFSRQIVPVSRVENRLKYDSLYHVSGRMYSSSGWMTGDDFTGLDAVYPQVVYSHGPCAPTVRQYASKLKDSSGKLCGLVTFGIVNNDILYVDGVVRAPKGSAKFIRLSSKDGDTNLDISAEYIVRGHVHATLVLTGKQDPDIVETTIPVDGGVENITSMYFKSMKVVVTDENNSHVALAVIQILTNGSLQVTAMVLNKTGVRTVEAEVNIRWSHFRDGNETKISIPVVRTNSPNETGWVGKTTIDISDSSLPHSLYLGSLELEVDFPFRETPLIGQFSKLDIDWHCSGIDHSVCKHYRISENGKPVDRGLKKIPPNGLASLYVHDDKPTVDVTLSIVDIPAGDSVDKVELLNGDSSLGNIPGSQFKPSMHLLGGFIGQGSFDYQQLGEVNVIITTTSQQQKREEEKKENESEPSSAYPLKSIAPLSFGIVLLLIWSETM